MFRILSNSSQRGNAIVEFALVLPVLITVTFGIVDVGRYAYYSIVVSNAARAGAAYGAQNDRTAGDTTGIQSAVTADAGSEASSLNTPTTTPICYNSSNSTISCGTGGSSIATEYVQVTVSGTFKPLLKYPTVPGQMTISDTATMRVVCPFGC
jgi:Flp pilus assembly protein TadG